MYLAKFGLFNSINSLKEVTLILWPETGVYLALIGFIEDIKGGAHVVFYSSKNLHV